VAGTLIQETFRTSAAIRVACEGSIMGNAHMLEADLGLAMAQCGVTGTSAESLARHVQTVIQGAFVLAKASGDGGAADMAREALGHLRRYFSMLFQR
jgi:TetR/AcrR family transcriptional repressor of nem operon